MTNPLNLFYWFYFSFFVYLFNRSGQVVRKAFLKECVQSVTSAFWPNPPVDDLIKVLCGTATEEEQEWDGEEYPYCICHMGK